MVLLKTAKDNQSGLVYTYDTLGGGPKGIKGKSAVFEGDTLEEDIPVVRLHTNNKKPSNELAVKNKLKSDFSKIKEFVRDGYINEFEIWYSDEFAVGFNLVETGDDLYYHRALFTIEDKFLDIFKEMIKTISEALDLKIEFVGNSDKYKI